MNGNATNAGAEVGNVALARRLRRRQGEIERALFGVCATNGNAKVWDPDSRTSLSHTLAAVTGYNLDCIERGEDALEPIPSPAIAQVRRAVRDGVSLDAFLVTVISAHTLMNEFIADEAGDMSNEGLGEVQALRGSILRRFASVLAHEYKQEKDRLGRSSARRQNVLVERLLSGAPGPLDEVRYALEMWHVGLVVLGVKGVEVTRGLAEILGTAVLTVSRDEETVWAWLGSRRKISSELVENALSKRHDVKARFAVGEPAEGLEGWRSTHLEAKAAMAVAIRSSATVTRFSQVALEAIAMQTPELACSLQMAYLGPLSDNPRRSSILRETLRAYLSAGRNASSAAVALRVTRRTVENRLRTIETGLGRPLDACSAELELALRLESLDPSLTRFFPE
jgi:PucR-like helix-turn-helix protein/diguanylate cyclase with GGDEF domain